MPSASKLSLKDPRRTSLIIAHREKCKIAMTSTSLTPKVKLQASRPEPYKLMGDSFCTSFQSNNGKPVIRLADLGACEAALKNPAIRNSTDKLFIELTIIGEPYVESELCMGDFFAPKNFLIETKYKEVCALQVQGLPDNENALEMFSVGTKIAMLNSSLILEHIPTGEIKTAYFFADERMDQRLFPIKKIIKMCRYCGEENAKQCCVACKASYCSRECQTADWKILKHKLVCRTGNSEPLNGQEFANLNLNEAPKSKLMDPSRISRILSFRAKYNFMFKQKILSPHRERFMVFKYRGDLLPEMEECMRPSALLSLEDMKCGNIYENKMILLTIIEEPLVGLSYAHFLVEDDNKDVALLAVNGLFVPGIGEKEASNQQYQFQVGATVSVMHPFYKLGEGDGLPMIRVDHQNTIQACGFGWRLGMCSFCGKHHAKRKCSGCKRLYCGEDCETKDREVLKHELVCETGPVPMTHLKKY